MIFETIFFLIFSILIITSFIGYGQIINTQNHTSDIDNFFFGLIIIAFLVTIIHFFIRINLFVSLIIIFIGIFLYFKNSQYLSLKFFKKNKIYLFLFLFLSPIFISQKYHEDFGYYHLPYVLTMIEQKIIFGLANSNIAYSHSSIWLNIISIFALPKNNFNFLTLPTFLIYFIFIVFSLKKILDFNKKYISTYFLIICLFYFILKFTRISEYGNDLPSSIFSILTIYYFLKYSETNIKQRKYFYFFCCFAFATFSVLIKFSGIPIFILPAYLLVIDFKILKKEIVKFNYLFILILCFIFFVQQFVYTGCFLFPSKLTCINVSWFNDNFLLLRENLELINKSYSSSGNLISKEDFIRNFNWFPYWLSRNYLEILEHLITMLFPIILFKIFLKRVYSKNILSFKNKKVFYLFILISFIFWFKFSPVYRFAVPYFLCLVFIITLRFNIIKDFSKKIFVILIIFSIFFSFSKNILRISNNDKIFFGIKKMNNNFYTDNLSENKFIIVRRPDIDNNKENGWQGRLCWDIPFVCSYNEILVNKKNGYLFFSKLNN